MNQLVPQQKRRDKVAIMGEMLQITRTGALKTQIMYKANLSFSQLNEYLSSLTAMGLLKKTFQNERETYIATSKGLEFLRKQQEIMNYLSQDAVRATNETNRTQNLESKNGKEEKFKDGQVYE